MDLGVHKKQKLSLRDEELLAYQKMLLHGVRYSFIVLN